MRNTSKFYHAALVRSPLAALLATMLAAGALGDETKIASGTDDALTEKTSVKRDPFWPVGYVPENMKRAVEGQTTRVARPTTGNDWNTAMKKVVINGVSSRAKNEFFAVINGQVKSVGENVTVNHEGTIYTWAVDSITPPGSVKLRRVSAL